LPAPQKGPAVSVPASIGSIPVVAGGYHGYYDTNGSHYQPMSFSWFQASTAAGGPVAPAFPSVIKSTTPVTGDGVAVVCGTVETPDFAAGKYYAMPNNLWARPVNNQSVGISINDLRLAVITQMYYEALARGGSRYEEQIQQFFGVTNPDSRIQHPEYLGGRRMQINVHEVTNTAQSEKDFLGDVGAQSVTAGSNSDFTKSFTEHGWLIGLAVVRYEHSYSQGLPKKFARSNKFDFYNPLFARIGEQPVYNYEIFSTVNSSNPVSNLSKVFGYQEAWASYRYNPNRVSGRIRPNVQDGFGHWTLDDNYATLPTLSSGWISEDKGNLDRVLAVTSSLNNQVFGDFYFQSKWTRVMPMYSVPGAIGQF
jgi:hypothetical protein